jgi:hypothetical protein
VTDASDTAVAVPAAPRTGGVRGGLAVVLVALAALFAVLYSIDNSRESHSYNRGATPPTTVHITSGRQYEISMPGGPSALTARVGATAALNCNYSQLGGSSTNALETTRLGSDTRTTHAVGTFIASVTGLVHIECRSLSSTFVDDADDVSGDPAGFFLLLATICLSLGVMLGLSALYRYYGPRGRDPESDGSAGTGTTDPGDYGSLLASPTDR